MKKRVSKFIAIICLFIYLVFGFLNSGNVGFCLGDEYESHFGLIFGGYETCCHDKLPVVSETAPQSSLHCECKDVGVVTSAVSQIFLNSVDCTQILELMNSIKVQIVAYCIDYCNTLDKILAYYQKAPPNYFALNSNIVKSSVVLLI